MDSIAYSIGSKDSDTNPESTIYVKIFQGKVQGVKNLKIRGQLKNFYIDFQAFRA